MKPNKYDISKKGVHFERYYYIFHPEAEMQNLKKKFGGGGKPFFFIIFYMQNFITYSFPSLGVV